MRILLVFFIIISVVIAIDPPAFIAQLMGISWGALAGAFLAPFLYGLYWKRVTKAAVWASFIAGVGITVSNMFINYIASPINAGALAMIAGLIVVPVVSVITKKPDEAIVDGIFNCLDEKSYGRAENGFAGRGRRVNVYNGNEGCRIWREKKEKSNFTIMRMSVVPIAIFRSCHDILQSEFGS